MPSVEPTYNPNFSSKDNPNWFKGFIMLQDEVPTEMISKREDSVFLKHRIVQVKLNRPKSFSQSIFATHLQKHSAMVPKAKEVSNYGWIPCIIALCFVFYSIAHFGYYKRMQQIFKAFFASRLFSQLSREGGIFGERVSLFLFSSYLLGFSLFFYKICEYYFHIPAPFLASFLFYLEILAGIIIFYLFKLGLFNLVGFIFKTSREISDYILNVYILGQISGVLLLPLIVFAAYMPNEYVISIGLVLLVILYLYSMFRGVTIAASKVKISVYYLFLYLCTLEILPLFLIAKVLSKIII